jgi:2'-5' RNA ligase
MIRTFIAVALPEEMRTRLGETSRRLKTLGLVGSFPKPESIHLTLKFLGDIEEASIGRVSDAMEQATRGIGPFEVEVGGLGVFPNRSNPRVVWIGVTNHPLLVRLQEAIERSLEPLGFPPEGRDFRAHLTLVRLKSRDNVKALAAYLDDKEAHEPLGTVSVGGVHLYRSDLRPDGARYTVLRSVALEPGA